jgi:hypothetical protein
MDAGHDFVFGRFGEQVVGEIASQKGLDLLDRLTDLDLADLGTTLVMLAATVDSCVSAGTQPAL